MRYLLVSVSLALLLIPFFFGVSADAATWYNSSWLKARKIQTDPADFTADLTNYPVYVNVTQVNIGTDSQADCDDFIFVNHYNTTVFPHEIETCDSTADWLEAWVKVPTAFNANATDIYMYYNNAGAADQQQTQATWNSNYKFVHHLNGTFIDSTSNGNTCTNTGSSAKTDEYIGDSRTWDGIDDNLVCGSAASIDNIFDAGGTFSAWVRYISDGESNADIISKQNIGTNGWNVATNTAASSPDTIKFQTFGATDAAWTSDAAVIPFSKWVFVTWTYDDDSALNNPILYINGSSSSVTLSGTPLWTSDAGDFLCLGNQANAAAGTCLTGGTVDGSMDEFRLSDIILSADWIKADWECQKGATTANLGASCITIGAQGTEPAAGDTVTVSDDFAIEDTASANLMGVVTVTDDFAIEDTALATSGDTATVSDDFAIEDTAAGLAPGIATVSDDFAIEDTASIFSDTVTVSDEFAIEDTVTSSAFTPARNAIVLSVNKAPFIFGLYSDATRMTCNASIEGGVIFNTGDNNLNICDGTNWILPDGTIT